MQHQAHKRRAGMSSRLGWKGFWIALWAALSLAEEARTQTSPPSAVRQYRTAAAFQNRQAYDLAIPEWKRFLDEFPRDPLAPKARHYWGVCLFQLRQYDAALPLFEEAGKQLANQEGGDANLFFLGAAQFHRGQGGAADAYPAAIEVFARLIADYPQSEYRPQAHYYRGESYYALGERKQASAEYQQLCDSFPKHELAADGLYAWGVALQELADHGGADQVFARFLQSFDNHELAPEVVLRRGEAAYAQGQFGAAAEFFSAASRSKFSRADYALLGWGDALLAQGRLEEALASYRQLLERAPPSPHTPQAALGAGLALFRLERWPEARQFLSKSLELARENPAEPAHWLARCCLRLGEPQQALAAADQGLAATPAADWLGELLMDRADALAAMPDRRKEAVDAYLMIGERAGGHPLVPHGTYMAAYAALAAGDVPRARELADAFLRKFPRHDLSPEAAHVAAEADLRDEAYPVAEQRFAKLIECYPEHEKQPTWRLRHALTQYHLKRFELAAAEIAPLLAALPEGDEKAEALYLQGTCLLELNRPAEAALALEKSWSASRTHPQAPQVLMSLARAYRLAKDLDRARATLEGLLQDKPEGDHLERAMYLRGEYAQAAGDTNSAVGAYQQLLEKFPQGSWAPQALLGIARSHTESGQFEKAEQFSSQLLRRFPAHPAAARGRYVRALALRRLGRLDEAVAEVAAFLSLPLEPAEASDGHYLLGLCQAGKGDPKQAADTFAKLLASDPQYDSADRVLYELGWAYRESGQVAKATEAFGRLAREFPGSGHQADAWLLLGEGLFEQRKYAEALEAFDHARAMEPSDPKFMDVALLHAGQAANALERWEVASQFLDQLAARAQDKASIEARIEKGRSLQGMGKLNEALAHYEKAAAEAEGELAARAEFMAGEVLFAQKNHAGAVRHYFKVAYGFHVPSWQAQALFEAGRCFEVLRKLDQARATYRELLEKFPESERVPAARKRLEALQ